MDPRLPPIAHRINNYFVGDIQMPVYVVLELDFEECWVDSTWSTREAAIARCKAIKEREGVAEVEESFLDEQ